MHKIDCIAKQKLNIIILVDASKSMQGKRIGQVNQAIKEIKDYLIDLQGENANVDFYMTIVPFSNDASFYGNERAINVNNLKFDGIKAGGWSNLHLAYEKLEDILTKESKGGIMPDFGGIAPIILLLTDGHPTSEKHSKELAKLETMPWFKVALRYGIAIELNDKKTIDVLKKFVGSNGDVVSCYKSDMLKQIIKVIVVTASKVKSTGSIVSNKHESQNKNVQQVIAEALTDADSWEW